MHWHWCPRASDNTVDTNENNNGFDFSLSAPVRKILESYRKTVFAEMYFLRDNGGRRYKVTDGQLIGRSGEGFAYSFNLEAELFLSEDAPITVTVGNESSKGNVLSCEDFQILAILESPLGDRISKAFISVEPWKLLESLNERLITISRTRNTVAVKLIEEGPQLRTKKPIDNVESGQDKAMEHALRDPITVIWGPPGTGKTHTMADIAIGFLSMGKTVLAVSHSNISVDGVVSKVAELMKQRNLDEALRNGEVLRFGHVRDEELAKDPDVVSYNAALKRKPAEAVKLKKLLEEKDELRKSGSFRTDRRVKIEQEIKRIKKGLAEDEKKCVERARFVATTVSRIYANKLFEGKYYDVVMFDEVSMAYVPQVFCAAMSAREKLVCVGDFRQLAPIAQGKASKAALSRDIFWYLGICDERQRAYYHPWLVMLDEQRRMHPKISAFPSRRFYSGLLKDHKSVIHARDDVANGTPYPGEAMNLIDLGGTYCMASKNNDNSRFNILSAVISFSTAVSAEMDNECAVGVITPYVAQVRLVRAMIQDYRGRRKKTNVSCATVHQFQGSERDVIVMDLVESFPTAKPGILMSSNENGSVDRLVNVAVTRARGKLVTVANGLFWNAEAKRGRNSFAALVDYHKSNDNVAAVKSGELAGFLADMDFGPNIVLYDDIEESIDKLIRDIDHAAAKIVLSIPDGKLIKPYDVKVCEAIKKARRRRVGVMLKCANWKELPEDWKNLGWQSDDADCPIVLIDDETCWYGMPLSRGKVSYGKTEAVVTVLQTPIRITGKHTVEMIRSLADVESRVVNDRKQSLKPRSGGAEQDSSGAGVDGLALYIKQHKKCSKCKSPMLLTKSWKKNKFYLKCSSCDEIAYLEKEDVNHYICVSQVRCSKCGGYLEAKFSRKTGVFVVCERDHTCGVDQI